MRRRRDAAPRDAGLALIVALLLTLIVFSLATVVLASAFHNVATSANSWRRLAAINAAESGVDQYVATMEASGTGLNTLKSGGGWTADGMTGNVWKKTSPAIAGFPSTSSYALTAEYFSDDGFSIPLNLNSVTDAAFPASAWVRLTSVGSAPDGCSSGAQCVKRTMQAAIALKLVRAGLQGAFAGMYICKLGNRFTVTGSNANLYFLGTVTGEPGPSCDAGDDVVITSGQLTTSGGVYVLNGKATLSRSTFIQGDLYAKSNIQLGAGGGTGTVGAGSCAWTASSQVLVCGNVKTEGTYTLYNTSAVRGTVSTCTGCAPVTPEFPHITSASYSSSNRFTSFAQAPGTYYISVDATSYPGACTQAFSFADKNVVTLNGDYTIVSKCGFTFGNHIEFRNGAAGATPPTLRLVTLYSATACVTADSRNSEISQNFDASAIRIYFYTPCTLTLKNQVSITGALVAGQLKVTGRTTLTTVSTGDLPLNGPTPGVMSGFLQRVLWLRETV